MSRMFIFSGSWVKHKYVLRLFSFQFIFTTQNLGLHSMCLTRISAKRRGSAYIIAFQLGLVTCNVMRVLVWMHLRPSPLLRHVSASLMSSRLVWMDPRDLVVNSASLAGVCSDLESIPHASTPTSIIPTKFEPPTPIRSWVMSDNVSRWLPLKMRTRPLRMRRITWPVTRGSKTITFLESPAPICLFTIQLLFGYDDD